MTGIAPASSLAVAPAPKAEREQLAVVARKFEAIFVRQMLSQARKASFGDALFGSQAGDTFRQMQDERFADIAADKGMLGLATAIEKQLAQKLSPSAGGK
ncbi:MAG: hypothetical protein RIS17_1658 [Pseudomonadota bacterium]|jgi:flagellar protein FlgJ